MKVELLAPGGSFESVIAAYNAGADAVYTGGLMFGARAGANNLTTEELIEALEYAHVHDRKLYLTVNTLLKDKEIETELYDYLLPLYENGLDAVIVQDIGVFKFIRDNFPLMHIHASTQMTIFGKDTVAFLKDLGASRIVTPREFSLKEIEDIKNDTRLKDMEIESFVHGALCYCYSGQCFMSSYIGGRSGNRGRCAQPCRMEYDVIKDGKVLNPGNNKYVLSPKDICTLKILPEIIKSGVYSLKIEGRMKKTEYITGVVSIYRKYLDMYLNIPDKYNVDENDIKKLADLFNRNGFNESYYKTNRHFLQVPLMANLSFRLAENVRLNLAAGPYVAYSVGDKNIGKYNEYTPGYSGGYGSYGFNYYGGNGGYLYGDGWIGQGFSYESRTHDNPFDWGLSFQAGLEIGSCVMSVGYDASLGKEYDYDSVDLKYHTFSLSVGYKFKLGK